MACRLHAIDASILTHCLISTQTNAERAAAVLVDELEALPSRVQEIAREFRNLALRRESVELALRRALGQLVLERDLDALLPARNVDG